MDWNWHNDHRWNDRRHDRWIHWWNRHWNEESSKRRLDAIRKTHVIRRRDEGDLSNSCIGVRSSSKQYRWENSIVTGAYRKWRSRVDEEICLYRRYDHLNRSVIFTPNEPWTLTVRADIELRIADLITDGVRGRRSSCFQRIGRIRVLREVVRWMTRWFRRRIVRVRMRRGHCHACRCWRWFLNRCRWDIVRWAMFTRSTGNFVFNIIQNILRRRILMRNITGLNSKKIALITADFLLQFFLRFL